MRLPTASTLWLAQRCAASHALPWVRTTSRASDRGTAVHRFLEVAPQVGRERALAQMPDEWRDFCAQIDLAQVPEGRREVAFAWPAIPGPVLCLGHGHGRDYERWLLAEIERRGLPEAAGWPWIFGTADVVHDHPALIADYKTGWPGPAKESPQLKFLALCLHEVLEKERVEIAHLRVVEDRIWWDRAELGLFDWPVIEEEVRTTVAQVAAAHQQVDNMRSAVGAWTQHHWPGAGIDVHPGEHCTRCPAATRCPATRALARDVAPLLTSDRLAADRTVVGGSLEEQDGRTLAGAWTFYRRLKVLVGLLEDELRRHAEVEPFPGSEPGKVVRIIEKPVERIDSRVALPILQERLGDEAASCVSTTKTAIIRTAGTRSARAIIDEIRSRGGISTTTRRELREVEQEQPALPAEGAQES